MDRRLLFVIIPIIIFVFAIHATNAEAKNQVTTHYKILIVAYSEVCQRMIDNHMNSTCPATTILVPYDTSNQKISGNFIVKNDQVIRTNPQLKNHWLWYDANKWIVCILCKVPLDKPDLFSVIFIEPRGFTYTYKTDNVTNGIYKSYKDRFTTPDCISTMIGTTNNFDYLLNDTIHYILSGCTKTNININQTNTLKQTPFSFDNPYSSLHYDITKLKADKHKAKNCINIKCNQTDPYHKSNWDKVIVKKNQMV